jgi:hypothetical protein
VATTKVCQGEIYELYMDLNMKFKFDAFEAYKSMLCAKHDLIIMCWMIDLNIKVEHLAFDVNQITFGLLVLICRLVKSLM